MDLSQVLDTMIKLSIAMAIGFGLNKAKIIDTQTNTSISGMILNVTSPALVLYSVSNQIGISQEALKLVGVGAVVYVVLPFAAFALVWLIKPKLDKRGVYQMLLVFANVSFMGFPVVQAIYGEQAIFYMNMFNIPFTLMIFSYGVGLLIPKGNKGKPSILLKDILTPGLFAGIFSLFIYFFQLSIPAFLVSTMGFIGGVTTPLSMIVIGSMIADFAFRDIFSDYRLFILSGIKLAVFPLIGYFVALALFDDPLMVGIVTITFGMPSASLCAMIGKQYGNVEQANSAALGVFISTVLSMGTIPLLIFLIA